MHKYLTAQSLEEAKEIKEQLIRSEHINAWIQTIVRDKEYRVHPGTIEEIVRVVNPK